MISIFECAFDENEKEMYRVFEDKEILETTVYAKLFPELYTEIKEQYHSSKDHFYYLSNKAYKQYQQKRFGLIN